jgi:hypothetical protein
MSFNEPKTSAATISLILGIVLALVPWGLGLIGVAVNLPLGALILAVAFGLLAYAFWIWERASRWHVALRTGTVVIAFCVYSYLIGGQIVREYRAEHRAAATKQPPDTRKSEQPKPQPPEKLPSEPVASAKPKPHPANFVYIVPGVWIVTGGWDFVVNHRGPEPSFNVEILLVDEVKQKQVLAQGKTLLTQSDLDSYRLLLKYPEIDPKGRGSVYATQLLWTPPIADHERYAIEITWRDGSVHQDLQIERIDDKWFWATQIKDRETKKTLVNCKDKGFPYGPPGDKPCFPAMALPAD